MSKKTYLSIIIPCYNEEKNIRLGALTKVFDYLSNCDFSWEVVIVDDGSQDYTVELTEEFIQKHPDFRLVKNSHQGKARTVISGILKAEGKFALFTDLDQATPLSELDKMIPWLKKGYEVVIGSRNSKRVGAPFLRSLMGPGFSFLRSKIIGLSEISDTQCGFKAFNTRATQALFKKLKLYSNSQNVKGSNVTPGFDVELLFIARKLGYRIKEVPVEWHYVETRRVSPIVDSVQGLKDIVRIKLNDLQGKYR